MVKSLYGLKQAARVWFKVLEGDLKRLGFHTIEGIECLFVRHSSDGVIYILAYVDDVLVMSTSLIQIKWAKEKLMELYKMTDLGELESFLGVEISRDRSRRIIQLTQGGYIEKILSKFGMDKCKDVKTPAETHLREESSQGCGTSIPFRQAVGSLMYLAIRTRPDISSAVGAVARHVENPTFADWKAVKRILRYIKGTASYGLVLGSDTTQSILLEGYSDADWGGDPEDRKSVSGFVVQLCKSSISWRSIKQKAVALSTAEAEYMALSEVAKEIIWLRRVLKQLGYPQEFPTLIYEDNQSCISWVTGDGSGMRAKHIE